MFCNSFQPQSFAQGDAFSNFGVQAKTTLQNYEDVGYLKALRHTLPGKSRGKVTWLKSELDKVKYGAYKNN